jgi:hypothetical protein
MPQAPIDQRQENVDGVVRLELCKGSARVVGRNRREGLYCLTRVTFEEDAFYDQRDAEGYQPQPAPPTPRRHRGTCRYDIVVAPLELPSRSVVDADIKTLAHGPQGLIDLLDLRAVAQIEEPVHLGCMPS